MMKDVKILGKKTLKDEDNDLVEDKLIQDRKET